MPVDKVILLGAGASASAKVPIASEMTTRFVKQLSSKSRFDSDEQALRFIIGALIAHNSAKGENPLIPPSIEDVINACNELSQRRFTEGSAFVHEWNQSVEKLEASFSEITPWTFDDLTKRLSKELISVTRIQKTSLVKYIEPFLLDWTSKDGAIIATLNYDNLLDLAAQNLNIWIDGWHYPVPREASQITQSGYIRVLRLHGCSQWAWTNKFPPADSPFFARDVRQPTEEEFNLQNYQPAVIFGGNNKLTPEGPFLDLFSEFRGWLSNVHNLVVIGYAFRDAHINEYIKIWINQNEENRMIVVDPGFKNAESVIRRFWESDRDCDLEFWKYNQNALPDYGRQYANRIKVINRKVDKTTPQAISTLLI